MKKIVCDLCESTEFIKENGMFVCQGCGTKYSLEEAKSMMKEVAGDPTPVSGAPVVSIPMGNPNQAQIDNILVLATTAYEAQNYAEAENYCNRAIELDAMCYKAWMLKAKAVGWQSKVDNLRIEESAHSFCKAIDFAPDEEKEEVKNAAVEELRRLGIALVSVRKTRFSGSPDNDERGGIINSSTVFLDSLKILLQHGNNVAIPDGLMEEIAKLIDEAAVAALNMTQRAWRSVEHPSKKDFDTYLGWNSNIETVLRYAIAIGDADYEESVNRYRHLKDVLQAPMNVDVHSETREWSSYLSMYTWKREYILAQSAKDTRNKQMRECDSKISEMQKKANEKKAADAKKAAEEKAARIKAYWEAHAEDKVALESEKKELETKRDALAAEINDLQTEINCYEVKGPVPSEVETEKTRNQIRELDNRRASLGIFSGKEKKQITEEIASLNGRLDSLKSKIEAEKKAREDERVAKTSPLYDKKKELEKQRDAAIKRIAAIHAELTKDPEA